MDAPIDKKKLIAELGSNRYFRFIETSESDGTPLIRENALDILLGDIESGMFDMDPIDAEKALDDFVSSENGRLRKEAAEASSIRIGQIEVKSPKGVPFRCPVCEGRGRVYDFYTAGSANPIVECHACEGTGIVWSGVMG